MKLKVGCTCSACKKAARKQIAANYKKLKKHHRQLYRIALSKLEEGENISSNIEKAIREIYA